jgi:NADH-quinone oxidoreductase subunit H
MTFNIYDFTSFTAWIDKSLNSLMSPTLALITEMVIIGIVFLLFYAVVGLFLVYAERKVCAFMQNRVGPNRVGPYGIFQTIADFIKLLMKELVYIKDSDKLLFNIAPFIVIIASFCCTICQRPSCNRFRYRDTLCDRRFFTRGCRHSACRLVIQQ